MARTGSGGWASEGGVGGGGAEVGRTGEARGRGGGGEGPPGAARLRRRLLGEPARGAGRAPPDLGGQQKHLSALLRCCCSLLALPQRVRMRRHTCAAPSPSLLPPLACCPSPPPLSRAEPSPGRQAGGRRPAATRPLGHGYQLVGRAQERAPAAQESAGARRRRRVVVVVGRGGGGGRPRQRLGVGSPGACLTDSLVVSSASRLLDFWTSVKVCGGAVKWRGLHVTARAARPRCTRPARPQRRGANSSAADDAPSAAVAAPPVAGLQPPAAAGAASGPRHAAHRGAGAAAPARRRRRRAAASAACATAAAALVGARRRGHAGGRAGPLSPRAV